MKKVLSIIMSLVLIIGSFGMPTSAMASQCDSKLLGQAISSRMQGGAKFLLDLETDGLTVDKAVDFYESRFLSVQLPGGIELMCRDIIAIKSEHVYSTIVLADGELSIRRSLKEWETLLPEKDFLRLNEKWIIHYAYVDKIKDDKVTLKNGERLAVSRRRKLQLRDGYISYCLRKGRYR